MNENLEDANDGVALEFIRHQNEYAQTSESIGLIDSDIFMVFMFVDWLTENNYRIVKNDN